MRSISNTVKNFLQAGLLAVVITSLAVFNFPVTPVNAATITSIRASAAATTSANASTPTGVDVSALTGDFTIKLQVSNLARTSGTATLAVRICVQDVAAADFTIPYTIACWQLTGPVTSAADKVFSISSKDLADTSALSFGQTNGKFRFIVERITANSTVTYAGWLEQ